VYPSALGRWLPLARELARRGHEVHFVTLHHDFRPGQEKPRPEEGVWLHTVAQMHVRGWGDERRPLSGLALLRTALAGTVALWRRAREVRADVYHICKPQPMNGLAGYLVAQERRCPWYLDCDDYEAQANRFTGRWQRAVVRLFEDALPRQADAVTVNTRFLAARVQRFGVAPERVVYVPNGVERSRFAGLDPGVGSRLRARLGLEGKPTVLYLGTLSLASHPLFLLLEAFALLVRHMPEARLVWLGGGEGRSRIERRVAEMGLGERVLFLGAVPPDQVPHHLLLADVTVDPVYDDDIARARSPLKLFESMACGIPVVTGDVGDRREILADGAAGLLVRPADAGALAEGMALLLQDPVCRRQMADAARERVQAYMWDRLAEDFLRVYQLPTRPFRGLGRG
jgi:glycosyltransferase involved in cell wall biosynthesis